MAIPIPKAEESVAVRAPGVAAPRLERSAAPSAFGAESAQAQQGLGEAVNRLGGALAQRLIERQEVDEEQQVMAAHNDFTSTLQTMLLDQEAGDDGRPKGILNRRLDQAKDSTKDFDAKYAEVRQAYLERVPQSRQKVALAARLDNDFSSARAGVIRHEVAQGNDAFKVQFSTTLERDPLLAQKILDGSKAKIPPAMAEAMQAEVDGKMFAVERAGLWDEMTGGNAFRLEDGSFDLASMQETVMSLEKPQDRKEKLWDYIRARADEERVMKTRADEARDRAFTNEVLSAQKRGARLDEALKMTAGYSSDATDRAQKEAVVKKLYAPKTDSDPASYISLWESIQSGGSSKREIDAALNLGLVNPKDWEQLRKDFYSHQLEGKNPELKGAWDRVEALAVEKFGSDRDTKLKFMYEMHEAGRSKGPEEIWKLAQDKLQKVPKDWAVDPPRWKADLERRDAENLAWGKVYEDLGREEAGAIGAGALFQGKKSYDLTDLDAFAKDLGGYEGIKKGTPANNAIQSLLRSGKLVTARNVKEVLRVYKDGQVPSGSIK